MHLLAVKTGLCPRAKSIGLLFGGQSIPETDKQNSRSAAKVALQRTLGKVITRVPYLNIAFQIAACANPQAAITGMLKTIG